MATLTKAACLIALVAGGSLPLKAETVEEFYRGKTIEFLVGAAAAGGYDLAARAIAHHMSRHLPGHPTIIVRNMPGATGLIMTNYLFNIAKRDGTAIGMPTSNIPMEPRLRLLSPDGSNVKFDVGRFNWIGTPVQEPQVTWVWHTAPAKSFADLTTQTILLGGTSPSADNYILPSLMNALTGTKLKVLTGYQGQNQINLAVERGEVQGNNTGLSNMTVNKPDWVKEGKIRILVQYGRERLKDLPEVPTAMDLAKSAADRELLSFYAAKFDIARPVAAPPDVPDDRVQALRAAFDATMQDAEFLDEAQKLGLDIGPASGVATERLIQHIQSAPQSEVDRLRQLLAPGK